MVNAGELEVSAVKKNVVYISQLSVQLQTVDTSLFANSAQYNTETEQNSKSNSTLLVLKGNVKHMKISQFTAIFMMISR